MWPFLQQPSLAPTHPVLTAPTVRQQRVSEIPIHDYLQPDYTLPGESFFSDTYLNQNTEEKL